MSDLVARLRGQYRIPIEDGLGPAGGEEPDNPNEFVRTFETSPIMKEAATRIESLEGELTTERVAREKAEAACPDKDRVMGELCRRLDLASIDYSDLIP